MFVTPGLRMSVYMIPARLALLGIGYRARQRHMRTARV